MAPNYPGQARNDREDMERDEVHGQTQDQMETFCRNPMFRNGMMNGYKLHYNRDIFTFRVSFLYRS